MAIQQVGGQGVYVITGSGRDPRRTSNGQSWADLVTKQKYMLYKSAHDQAVREYEAGTITDKERQRRIDQLRKDIRQERTDIARLERGQLSENERRERQNQRDKLRLGTQTVRSPTGSSGTTEGVTDSGIPIAAEYEDQLVKDESKLRQNKIRASAEVAKIENANNGRFRRALAAERNGTLSTKLGLQSVYDRNIDAYTKAKSDEERAQTELTNKQKDIDQVRKQPTQADFEVYYRDSVLKGADPSTTKGGRSGSSRGSVTTKTVDKGVATALPDVDYSAEIGRREERIADLNRQILEAEGEPRVDPINVIKREQEIGREEYGLGVPRERRRLFGRRAEMEALGMEEEEPQVEEVEVEPDPVSEMMAKGKVVDTEIAPITAQRYIVQEGDTLGSIAQQAYKDPSRYMEIAEASGITDPNLIEVGQQIIIPQDQPQMPTAPVGEPVVAEPMVDEVVEGERPRESLDMSAMEMTTPTQQIVKDNVDVGEYLGDRATPQETTLINTFLNNPEKYLGPRDQFSTLDHYLEKIPTPTEAPAPTPTGMSSVAKFGPIMSYKEAMGSKPKQKRSPIPPLQLIRKAFDPVRNLDRRDKQQVGLHLLQQAKQAFGVSSKEYQKVKDQILSELGRAIDPKKAKQMKVVKTLQETSPSQYYRLGDDIRGLSEESKRMVVQLFPVNDETKLDEIESLYKNAQQQLKLSVVDRSQKKKALDMLDLMYMAVISDKR